MGWGPQQFLAAWQVTGDLQGRRDGRRGGAYRRSKVVVCKVEMVEEEVEEVGVEVEEEEAAKSKLR